MKTRTQHSAISLAAGMFALLAAGNLQSQDSTAWDPSSPPTVVYDSVPTPQPMAAQAQALASPAADILLIQTSDPWERSSHYLGNNWYDGITSDTLVLDSLSPRKSYQVATWQQINSGAIDVFSYQVILIVNDQVQQFYNDYAAKRPLFEQYVQNGGTLIFFAAGDGWAGGSLTAPLPGGVTWSTDYKNYNRIALASHSIVTAVFSDGRPLVDADLYSNYASHGSFGNLPAGTKIILQNTDSRPTLIEYRIGKGTVLASTLTWEHCWSYHTGSDGYGTFARKALDDVFLYAFTIAGGYVAEGLKVDVYPEDSWLPTRPTLYKAQGDLIDIVACIQNNTDASVPGMTLTMEIDESFVQADFIHVYGRNSADHIAVEMPIELAPSQFTDTVVGGKRTITISGLTVGPQRLMPENVWNDFVFRFRLRNPMAQGTAVDASATVSATGFKSASEKLSAGGKVQILSQGKIILTNRELLYKQYVKNGSSIDWSKRDQLHQLWESMYKIADERQAVIYFVDKEEYVEDTDHGVTSDIIREWGNDRLHLANGDTQGHYHYDANQSTGLEETLLVGQNAVNQVGFKVRAMLTNAIAQSGGIPSNGRDVAILGGDGILPFFRLFDTTASSFKQHHDATGVTKTDADNGYLFSDQPYRDADDLDYRQGGAEDLGIGRLAGPDIQTIRAFLLSSDSTHAAPNLVKVENAAREGELKAYQALGEQENYTVISSVDGVTLDLPGTYGVDRGDDPARWSPTFSNLFCSINIDGIAVHQFDMIRFICHGSVTNISNTLGHNYFSGADIRPADFVDYTYPYFVFDACLVGIVDGSKETGLLNNLFNKAVRGVLGSSAVTYSTHPGISTYLDRFCTNFVADSLGAGLSLSRAISSDAAAGIAGHLTSRLEMNCFGVPWATVSHPTQKTQRVQGLIGIPSVMSSEIQETNGLFRQVVTIDTSHFDLQVRNGFTVLTLQGGFDLFQQDGLPVLPIGEFDFPLPKDSFVSNIAVHFEQQTNLGPLNWPAFQLPDPIAIDPDAPPYGYVLLPSSYGEFPTNRFQSRIWSSGGQKTLKCVVFPASLTESKELLLSQRLIITFDYETALSGFVNKFATDADVYGPAGTVSTTTSIRNTSGHDATFEIAIELKDDQGIVLSTQSAEHTIATGASAEINVNLITPAKSGTYRVDMTARDATTRQIIGKEGKFIRVVSGKIQKVEAPPLWKRGSPGTIQALFLNSAMDPLDTTVDITIHKVGWDVVAKLPQFSQTVASNATASLQTQWIPPQDLAEGSYFAAVVVKAGSETIGPAVAYFSLVDPTTAHPPIALCHSVTVNNDPGLCSAAVAAQQVDAGSYDPDGGPITLALAPDGPYPVGTNAVTLTVTKTNGLTATCTSTVIVIDVEPPLLTCPTNVTAEFQDEHGATVTYTVAANDGCQGPVVPGVVPPSGSLFPIGITTISCTATDSVGNIGSCAFPVTVLGARGVKQNVLGELTTLRSGVTNPDAIEKLDQAIASLTASLVASLWQDQTHLSIEKVAWVFQQEKNAVTKLRQLLQFSEDVISHAAIQSAIDRILKSDRLLAVIAIAEAKTAGNAQKKLDQAMEHLAQGDEAFQKGNYEPAIEHYRNAYQHALFPVLHNPNNAGAGRVRFNILGKNGGIYDVQASTNLVDWTPAGTVTADSSGTAEYQAPADPAAPARFFRVLERQP